MSIFDEIQEDYFYNFKGHKMKVVLSKNKRIAFNIISFKFINSKGYHESLSVLSLDSLREDDQYGAKSKVLQSHDKYVIIFFNFILPLINVEEKFIYRSIQNSSLSFYFDLMPDKLKRAIIFNPEFLK